MKNFILILLFTLTIISCSKKEQVDFEPTLLVKKLPDFIDDRDGQSYEIVSINDQTWMAENLKFRLPQGAIDGCFTYGEEEVNTLTITVNNKDFAVLAQQAVEDGRILDVPDVPASLQPAFQINLYASLLPVKAFMARIVPYPEAYQVLEEIYDELFLAAVAAKADESRDKADRGNGNYSKEYGYLYTFDASKKAIPDGWRIPTDEDWKKLEESLGIPKDQIDLLDEWRGSNQAVFLKKSNKGVGFNAKLGGAKVFGVFMYGSPYINKDANAYFWSSSEVSMNDSTQLGITRSLAFDRETILRGTSRKEAAYHLRLIKK